MASTGAKFALTGSVATRTSATTWTNPGNISSDNAVDATCLDTTGNGSYYLVCTNFAFAVPATATIRGASVVVQASEHSSGTEVLNAQLQDSTGTLIGGTKANTISGTTKANYTYGSTSDVWSASLTPTLVNNSTFGVRLWFATSHDIRIDFVTMTIEYSETVSLQAPPNIAAAGYTPSLNYGVSYEPGTGAVTAAGYAPDVIQTVQDVRVSFARFDTQSTAGIELPAATGQLTAEGFAPGLEQTFNVLRVPGEGVVTAEGYTPAIAHTENQFIACGAGELTAASDAPTVARTASYDITPLVGAVDIDGYPPSLSTTTINVVVSWAQFDTAVPALSVEFGRALTNIITFSPSIDRTDNHAITIGVAEITAAGLEPSLTGQLRVTTGVAEVTAEGYATDVVQSIIRSPGIGDVRVVGYAPTAYHGARDVRVSWATFDPIADSRPIGVAELRFDGYPPAIGAIIIGGAGHRDISWTHSDDPGVTGYYVYWDSASRGNDNYLDYTYSADVPGAGIEDYTVTGLNIGQTYYFNISSHGAGGHDDFESQLFGEISAEALDTGLVIYGYPPVVSKTLSVLRPIGLGDVRVVGYELTLQQSASLPSTAQLTAAGYDPTIAQTAHHFVDIGVAALTAAGLAASAEQAVIDMPVPGTATIGITGYTPEVAGDLARTPDVAELTAEGFAPDLALSDFLIIFPGTGEITADAPAPGVVRSDLHWVTSEGSDNFALVGFAPTLLEAGSFSLGAGTAAVVLQGYAPAVAKGERQRGARSRRRVIVEERRREEEIIAAPPIKRVVKLPSVPAAPAPIPLAEKPMPLAARKEEGLSSTDYLLMAQAAQGELDQQNEQEIGLIFAAIQEERRQKRERLRQLIQKARQIMELDGTNDPELWYIKRK